MRDVPMLTDAIVTDAVETLELAILQHMDDRTGIWDFDVAFNLAFFAKGSVTKEIARAVLRGLTDKGFSHYARGLWSEDGEPRGAGYGITEKGRHFLKNYFPAERMEKQDG